MAPLARCLRLAIVLLALPWLAAAAQAETAGRPWQGFYAGLAGGGRLAAVEWITTGVCPTSRLCAGGPGLDDRQQGFDSAALRVGGFAGHNWAVAARWVAGLEADIGWANNRNARGPIPGTANSGGIPAVTNGDTASVNLNWDASLRARAGNLVLPGTLLFATFGLAVQRIEAVATCNNDGASTYCTSPPGSPHDESIRRFLLGWTVGAGVEHQIGARWLARLEYRYADFGNAGLAFFSQNVGVGGDDRIWANVHVRTHTAGIGMAYRF